MSINKFNSCERNNYFFGKLMTVKDFENEQTYFNAKRHLCNNMLHGFGIVSGLKVFMINNQTLSIDAGLAVDQNGREIMVPESCVKKVSVINGFEDYCDSKDLYLCLKYKEDLEETTFSVASSSKGNDVNQEYNRVHEGYDLFFTDKVPAEKNTGLNYLMFDEKVLYTKDGITVKLVLPKYINPSKLFRISVVFEKSNIAAPVNFKFKVSGEFFKNKDGSDFEVEYKETEVSTFKTCKQDYFVYCDAVADTLTDIIIDKKDFELVVGNKKNKLDKKFSNSVVITGKSLKDVLVEQYYSLDLDSHFVPEEEACIYLAKLNLVSNQSDYFIEAFENNPFNQCLLNTQVLSLFNDLDASSLSTDENGTVVVSTADSQPTVIPQVMEAPVDYVTGLEEITLGFYPKVGKSYFSNEFVHGLGYGQIAAVVAIENDENESTGEEHLFYFGNRDVFDDEELTISSAKADVAAIVNPERGTMKIGIKLLDKTEQTSVKVRWWAFKPSNNNKVADDDVVADDSVNVVISPPTAQIEPLGQYRFTAKVEGASSQEVKWFMAEEGTGTIDSNGLYTAPSKEGVYEIKAQSAKFANRVASAYIVVSTY